MIEERYYKCELCGKSYRSPERAEECEASHARIRRTSVESYAGKYPCWIRVVFDDGLTRLYREVS